LMGSGLAGCGAVLAWAGWKKRDAAWLELEAWVCEPRMVLNAVLVIGALIFYALVVDVAGFFVTAFAFLAVLFVAFGVTRRWIAPIAAAMTLGLHFAFYTLLRVPLPWGWLEGMAW
jgi:putative tricarboxylic transport membrane protein